MISSDCFGFYCDQYLQRLFCVTVRHALRRQGYTSTDTVQATISARACGVFTMQPRFRTPSFRLMRSVSFALLGLSAFVPVLHGIILNGWELQNERMSILYFLGLGLLNGTGTLIYAVRMPERW